MITVAAFAVVAAAGALGRAAVTGRWNGRGGIAAGTLAVNVTGSFLLGLLAGTGAPAVTVLGVAGLGAYTTFSGFAHDVVTAAGARRFGPAAAYAGATYGLGIAAAAVGVAIGT